MNGSKSANDLHSAAAAASSSSSSTTPSSSFYIFRRKKHSDDDEKAIPSGYNAETINPKYSDSALGIIKNGVVSMWGGGGSSSPRHGRDRSSTSSSFTPKGMGPMHKVSSSAGGFPQTASFLGSNVKKRTFSNVSFESMGDLFSDTLSVASGGSFGSDVS